MLQVYYQTCRLVVLVHALMETKAAITKTDSQNPWFLVAEHSGVNLARTWGQQALGLSEGILITALSRPELALLSSAPDNFFSMITLATIFVILSKWSVFENCGEQLPGSSDPILARVVERLSLIACSPDHIAAKCARVIGAGLRSFRRKLEKSEEPKEFSRPMLQHFSSAAREFGVSGEGAGSRSSGQAAVGYPDGTTRAAGGPTGHGAIPGGGLGAGMYPHQNFPNLAMTDPNYFMNSDIFLDSDFWSSFMGNLADGNGMGMMKR
jgi:hypothetical protein